MGFETASEAIENASWLAAWAVKGATEFCFEPGGSGEGGFWNWIASKQAGVGRICGLLRLRDDVTSSHADVEDAKLGGSSFYNSCCAKSVIIIYGH